MSEINEEELRKNIEEILKTADLKTTSVKKVRLQLEKSMGLDLKPHVSKIEKIVMEIVDREESEEEEEKPSECRKLTRSRAKELEESGGMRDGEELGGIRDVDKKIFSYSFPHLADIHLIYGFARGDPVKASKEYKIRFPTRPVVDPKIFPRLHEILSTKGMEYIRMQKSRLYSDNYSSEFDDDFQHRITRSKAKEIEESQSMFNLDFSPDNINTVLKNPSTRHSHPLRRKLEKICKSKQYSELRKRVTAHLSPTKMDLDDIIFAMPNEYMFDVDRLYKALGDPEKAAKTYRMMFPFRPAVDPKIFVRFDEMLDMNGIIFLIQELRERKARGFPKDEEEEEEEVKPAPKTRKRKNNDDDDGKPKKKKAPAKKAGGSGKGGYTRPYKLSPALSELMGAEEMPRHEVVKRVWAIIKEKQLYDPNNRQFAICDDALYQVIGTKRFRTFGMMKYLKNHFLD